MAPFLRIAAAVLVVVSLAAFLVHSPPGWLRNQVDRARAAQDPWAAYLAPTSACKSQADAVSEQRTMICLLDWARAQRGLKPLRVVYPLNRSSILKALAIARCADFSHTPCHKPFADTFDAVGYRGPVSPPPTARTSPGAQERPDRPAWSSSPAGSTRRTTGRTSSAATGRSRVSRVLPLARFLGKKNVEIWVSQFGVRG